MVMIAPPDTREAILHLARAVTQLAEAVRRLDPKRSGQPITYEGTGLLEATTDNPAPAIDRALKAVSEAVASLERR